MIPKKQPDYTAHWEGFVGHAYLDSEGYLTVGYGHRISGVRDDRDRPFLRFDDDMNRDIHHTLAGLLAADTGIWIREKAAKALLQDDLEQAVLRLMDILGPEVWRGMDGDSKAVSERWYGKQDRWPVDDEVLLASPRQIVLMDIVLNMGSLQAFPKFTEAVKAGDWERAEAELVWKSITPGPDGRGWTEDRAKGHTAYYKTRPERAELNAAVILSGEWPDA